MFYASKRVGNVIIVKIHFYVYSGFLYRQREEYFDKKGLKGNKRMKNFPIS